MESIKVAVRVAPNITKENKESENIVQIDSSKTQCTITRPSGNGIDFKFDSVFSEHCSQEEIYNTVASNIVEDVMKGINGTICMFGQTGTGKTYTLTGPDKDKLTTNRGIAYRAFEQIFNILLTQPTSQKTRITISSFEVVNGKLRDLLHDTNNLQQEQQQNDKQQQQNEKQQQQNDKQQQNENQQQKEHGTLRLTHMKNGDYCVAGASSRIVNSLNEIIDEYNKAISSVAIDEDGFYLVSHLFFIINVETFYTIENSDYIQSSFLKLVDFAGTENKRNKRWKKGPNFWANAIEMMTWNNFPVDLGRCIISLTSSRSRPYYTESIITQLLKDSFGRNSHTAIIATISQIKIDFNETISTLRYAEHMKKIKNKPETNIFKIEHHSIK